MLRCPILLLLMLWLPLQGFAAPTMSFCRHDFVRLGRMADSWDAVIAVAHASAPEDPLEHGAQGRGIGTHTNGFKCNNCGACRLACAAVLPTTSIELLVESMDVAPLLLTPLEPTSVVLDLPHPPPLPSI